MSQPDNTHVNLNPVTPIRLTIRRDACLIGVERPGIANPPDLTARAYLAAAAAEVTPLVVTQASAAGSFCLLAPRHGASALLDALRSEFLEALSRRTALNLWARMDVAVLNAPLAVLDVLGEAGVNLLLIHSSGPDTVWLVIADRDVERARAALTRQACYNVSVMRKPNEQAEPTDEPTAYPEHPSRHIRHLPLRPGYAYTGVGGN